MGLLVLQGPEGAEEEEGEVLIEARIKGEDGEYATRRFVKGRLLGKVCVYACVCEYVCVCEGSDAWVDMSGDAHGWRLAL